MINDIKIIKSSFFIPSVICAFVFSYLLFFQGYSTGYDYRGIRYTVWWNMGQGYTLDGGEWSFGRFVPFAVVGLIYTARKELSMIEVRPASLSGALVLMFAFFLYFGGYKANQVYIAFASMQLMIAGFTLWFLGGEWFVKTFWLWCLLGMMWPLRFLIEPIAFPLQIVMVKLTSSVLDLIGVGVQTNGSAIRTDTLDPISGEVISLNIAAACSGLRSLFALIMLSLIIGYLQLRTDWKRFVLLCCVPFVAVAGNFVRMMMLYFGSRFKGSEFAIGSGEGRESAYHINSGLVVFVVAVMLMLAIVQVLNRGMKYFQRRKLVVKKAEGRA